MSEPTSTGPIQEVLTTAETPAEGFEPASNETGSEIEQDARFAMFRDVLEDLFSASSADPLSVVLRHALLRTQADTAGLALPIGPQRLEVRAVVGVLSDELIGQSFERAGSVAGRVIESGQPVLADAFLPRVADVDLSEFGRVVVVPLFVGSHTVGALSLARLAEKAPFTEGDLNTVSAFAHLAGIALHLDQARAQHEAMRINAERDRITDTLRENVIRHLSEVVIGLESVIAHTEDIRQRARLHKAAALVDTVVRRVREAIYYTPPVRRAPPSTRTVGRTAIDPDDVALGDSRDQGAVDEPLAR